MPFAVARYFCGRIATRHVLPVLWMTSCFRVMTNSHKNPFTVPLCTLARYMLSSCVCPSVCLSVCHNPVSYRNHETDQAGFGTEASFDCAVRNSSISKNKGISLCNSVPNFILDFKNFARASQSSCCQQVYGRSSLLTTLTTVDVWLDAHS